MNRGRVGEERGGKETDGCPLTVPQRSLETPWDASSSSLRQRPTVHCCELYKLLGCNN
jgi:hypothetical protein